jgi:hypothetical protein
MNKSPGINLPEAHSKVFGVVLPVINYQKCIFSFDILKGYQIPLNRC